MTSFLRYFFVFKRKEKYHSKADSVELRNVSIITHDSFKSVSVTDPAETSQSSFPSEISKVESIEIVPGPDGRAIRRGSSVSSSLHSKLGSIEILDVDKGESHDQMIEEEEDEDEDAIRKPCIQRPISSSGSSSEAELMKINKINAVPQSSGKPEPSAIGVAFAHMLLQKFEVITNPEMRQEEQFTLILISRIYTTPQDVIMGLSAALEGQEPRVQKWVHDHKIVMDVQHVEKMGDICRANRKPRRQRMQVRRASLAPETVIQPKTITQPTKYSTLPVKKSSPPNVPANQQYQSVRCVSLSTDARDSGVVVTSSEGGSQSGRSDRSSKGGGSGGIREVNVTGGTIEKVCRDEYDPWTKSASSESMINMEISAVLKELDCLVSELNDFVCLSEKVKPVSLAELEEEEEVQLRTESSEFRNVVCSDSNSSFGRRFIMELPTVIEEISSTDGDADGSQTSGDTSTTHRRPSILPSSPVRYLKQIEATLQVIELWSETSVPDFDNEKTLIAIETVSDSIRVNLLDMERCDIITHNSADGYRSRAVKLVPSLLLKLNHERAYRARELEQQQLAQSKTLHLSGLTKSIQIWKFSACYATNIYHLCKDFNQLAYHLTALELDKMSHVWPCELIDCIKPKSVDLFDIEQSTTSRSSLDSYKEPPPSLEAYVSWFNRLSYFACSSVLLINPKSRGWSRKCADLLTYFINTAVACAEMGNFNSALAIALGLTLTPAGRLSKAWKKVDESKIKILRHIINPDQNFKNYRMIFKAVSSKSFDDDSVLVPFFSLFLKDMYFLGTMILQEDSSKVSHLGTEAWHEQMKQLSIPIRTFKRCQTSRQEMFEGADSQLQDRILHELQNTLVLDDNSLMRLSFKLQGPETPLEKNQYHNFFKKK